MKTPWIYLICGFLGATSLTGCIDEKDPKINLIWAGRAYEVLYSQDGQFGKLTPPAPLLEDTACGYVLKLQDAEETPEKLVTVVGQTSIGNHGEFKIRHELSISRLIGPNFKNINISRLRHNATLELTCAGSGYTAIKTVNYPSAEIETNRLTRTLRLERRSWREIEKKLLMLRPIKLVSESSDELHDYLSADTSIGSLVFMKSTPSTH